MRVLSGEITARTPRSNALLFFSFALPKYASPNPSLGIVCFPPLFFPDLYSSFHEFFA